MLVVHFIQGHMEKYPKLCHCITVNHRTTQRKASMLWKLLVYLMSDLQNSVHNVLQNSKNNINQHFSFWVTAIWLTWLVSNLHNFRAQTSHFKINVYLKNIHQQWIYLDNHGQKGFSFEGIIANFYSSDFSEVISEIDQALNLHLSLLQDLLQIHQRVLNCHQ